MEQDPTKETRKSDHIELAFQSQVSKAAIDNRFYYEPMLAGHNDGKLSDFEFLGKTMHAPLWVSSMTGGTQKARQINTNLALACKEFGLGMGLGSCRSLLESDERLDDFNLRPIMGKDALLYANLGVAQIENLLKYNKQHLIANLIDKLNADGLIIHVNPLQEWLQPEGDSFEMSPLEVIKVILSTFDFPVIVKEVGQGFGYNSLKELMQLPLAAIDFAAHGGTNFAYLELLRSKPQNQELYSAFANVGHDAEEMVDMYNALLLNLGSSVKTKQVIISGGIKGFLDGYYLMQKLKTASIYGQASAFLKHAQNNYTELHDYISSQLAGLQIARAYLRIKQ